jgi:hypothetical protein
MAVCGSFLKGFDVFYQEQLFCDLMLSLNGRRYKTHQLVLVHSSEYFENLIQKENSKGKDSFLHELTLTGGTIVFDMDSLNKANVVLTNELFEKILKVLITTPF